MYWAVFDRIAPAANKAMLTLFNGATGRKVVVNRIYRFNWQTGAQTGVLLEQELREVTAHSGGSSITINRWDEADPAPTSGIVCTSGATVTLGGRGLITRIYATSEEMALAATNVAKDLALLHDAQLVYWRRPGSKGLTLATGRGVTIQNTTSSTIGSVSYRVEFDDEPA